MFFGHSHSDIGFDRGGKGNVDSYTLGLCRLGASERC
ncbi:autotransporter outer membrane beta-barrel domain-containing protein [Shigella flexneri]